MSGDNVERTLWVNLDDGRLIVMPGEGAPNDGEWTKVLSFVGNYHQALDSVPERQVAELRAVLRLACPTPDKQGVMAFNHWDHERVRTAAWPQA